MERPVVRRRGSVESGAALPQLWVTVALTRHRGHLVGYLRQLIGNSVHAPEEAAEELAHTAVLHAWHESVCCRYLPFEDVSGLLEVSAAHVHRRWSAQQLQTARAVVLFRRRWFQEADPGEIPERVLEWLSSDGRELSSCTLARALRVLDTSQLEIFVLDTCFGVAPALMANELSSSEPDVAAELEAAWGRVRDELLRITSMHVSRVRHPGLVPRAGFS